MKIKNFVGIDVSKLTLDITWLNEQGEKLGYARIANGDADIAAWAGKLKTEHGLDMEETVFCMEYTGVYNIPLITYLSKAGAKIWMESGNQIKRSMGAVRGKNDKVDSERIAQYAYDKRQKMRLWKAPRETVSGLGELASHRALLASQKKAVEVAYKEKAAFKPKTQMAAIKTSSERLVKLLRKEIADIEKQMLALIKQDPALCKVYGRIVSVKGVGLITAVHIIVATNEFLSINDPKKFGCYCGVVPFGDSSGTSRKGKDKVSHMANKTMKTLLHLCATSAIKAKGELRDYYLRKVADGKNKMLVINAVRNKIILRVFACVNNDRNYEENYCNPLA